METGSPRKIQFTVPLLDTHLDPEAAEQVRGGGGAAVAGRGGGGGGGGGKGMKQRRGEERTQEEVILMIDGVSCFVFLWDLVWFNDGYTVAVFLIESG